MNAKRNRYLLAAIACLASLSIAAFSFTIHPSQDPIVTVTATITAFVTATGTPTPTPTSTPTATPTETSTMVPPTISLQITPLSARDIHSEFLGDFDTIERKLDNIYEKVDSPPGWFLIENFLSDYIYEKLNPSPTTGGTTYLLFKILGSLGVTLKIVVTVAKLTGKGKEGVWPVFNTVSTAIIFVYALLFILVLFFPPDIQQSTPASTAEQISLTQLDQKLDLIVSLLEASSPVQPTPGAITGSQNLSGVQTELQNISTQLSEMSVQDQQTGANLSRQIDQLNSQLEEMKAISAKRGLQVFNTILLLAILGILIYYAIIGKLKNP